MDITEKCCHPFLCGIQHLVGTFDVCVKHQVWTPLCLNWNTPCIFLFMCQRVISATIYLVGLSVCRYWCTGTQPCSSRNRRSKRGNKICRHSQILNRFYSEIVYHYFVYLFSRKSLCKASTLVTLNFLHWHSGIPLSKFVPGPPTSPDGYPGIFARPSTLYPQDHVIDVALITCIQELIIIPALHLN